MSFDIEHVRRDFPILASRLGDYPLTYLDNAATTQKPMAVIEALTDFYCHSNANVHRGSHQLSTRATRLFEQARRTLLAYLGAGPGRQLIWTRGATEAINLVAQGWLAPRLGAGDEVLVSALEHHANLIPWQQLCARAGAVLKVILLTEAGTLDLDAFARLLGPRTRLLAVTQVSNALGVVTPIETLVQAAHAAGAAVLVDGAQAVAHQQPDLERLGADFYVFSGHKLFGPTGIGGLCVRTELAEAMEPVLFGGEMVEQVSFSESSFTTPPLRFEAGTPHMAGAIGLAAAVDYLQGIEGTGRLAHEQRIYRLMEDALLQIRGIRVLAPEAQKLGALSFVLEQGHGYDLGLWLDQYGIAVRTGHHCAMPLMQALNVPGTLRASVAFYNTEAEVLRLATAVERWLHADQVSVVAAEAGGVVWQRLDAEALCAAFRAAGPWQKRYRPLMQLGDELEPGALRARADAQLIKGCESDVWLSGGLCQGSGRFSFDSDARVIRGMAVVLLAAVNGRTAAEIKAFDFNAYLAEVGLDRHLSPSRGNGLRGMLEALLAAV